MIELTTRQKIKKLALIASVYRQGRELGEHWVKQLVGFLHSDESVVSVSHFAFEGFRQSYSRGAVIINCADEDNTFPLATYATADYLTTNPIGLPIFPEGALQRLIATVEAYDPYTEVVIVFTEYRGNSCHFKMELFVSPYEAETVTE